MTHGGKVVASQKSQQSVSGSPYDDKDGHYIVVENDDLTSRYKIIRLLGQGTFGKVVEAFDRVKKKMVAIKIIRAVQKYRDASKVEIKVLQTLKKQDPYNLKRCIQLVGFFDFRNHVCMVFDLLAQSIFDFLKENHFSPFPTWHIQSFARQIIEAVEFLHSLRLIHTDLKPENLMLERSQSIVRKSQVNIVPQSQLQLQSSVGKVVNAERVKKELVSTSIQLIDFGSAIFENDYHSSVVSTRHYRAPEIIMGLGWSFPCDIWSIGCILVEFFTGDALFQTHDNLEHLAMMEVVLGKIPEMMIRAIPDNSPVKSFFKSSGNVNWPSAESTKASRKYVRSLRPLSSVLPPHDEVTSQFLDLVQRMLTYEAENRITAAEALRHPFLTC